MGRASVAIAHGFRSTDSHHDGGFAGFRQDHDGSKTGPSFCQQGKRPLLVAADLYGLQRFNNCRHSASKLDIPVLAIEGGKSPLEVVRSARELALSQLRDVVIH